MKLRRAALLALVCLSSLAAAGEAPAAGAFALDRLDEPAPELELDGGRRLSTLRGRWVVLHFWATWCSPCAHELPALERLYRRWKDREVAFFAIAVDGEESAARVLAFARGLGLSMPTLLAREPRASERYLTWGVPVTYFIDPEGRVVARALGPRDWDRADAAVSSLLGGAPGATAPLPRSR